MNRLRKALEDGYELLWHDNNTEGRTSLFIQDGKLQYSYVSGDYSEQFEVDTLSVWEIFINNEDPDFTIGSIKFPKVKTIAESMSNHAKCIRCKDEIFMAGSDRKDFVCYRCRN